MKKWYRVLNPFSDYQRGALICPEGLNRESLQVRGWITRHPVFIGPRKPTPEDIAAWAAAQAAPGPAPEPEPAPIDGMSDDEDDVLVQTEPEPEVDLVHSAFLEPQPEPRRRGRHGR